MFWKSIHLQIGWVTNAHTWKKGAPVGCHAIIGWNNAGKKKKNKNNEDGNERKKIKWMNEGKERKKKIKKIMIIFPKQTKKKLICDQYHL